MTAKLKSGWDKSTECLMSGYISHTIDVPPLIHHLCLKFYWQGDYFETAYESNRSKDKLQITGVGIPSSLTSNYCHRQIESTKKAIYKWTLYTTDPIILGITSYPTPPNYNWYHVSDIVYYGLKGRYRRLKAHNDSALEGIDHYLDDVAYGETESAHTMALILDLEAKQLSFEINGDNKGVAFESVYCRDDIRYTLAVAFLRSDTIVTLISFEHNM